MISEVLRDEGYTVRTAADGLLALAALAADHPDLVLLDLNLAGILGLEVLHAARTRSLTRVPMVLVTASHPMELREQIGDKEQA
jgi:CheY-like chemotaxis protein